MKIWSSLYLRFFMNICLPTNTATPELKFSQSLALAS